MVRCVLVLALILQITHASKWKFSSQIGDLSVSFVSKDPLILSLDLPFENSSLKPPTASILKRRKLKDSKKRLKRNLTDGDKGTITLPPSYRDKRCRLLEQLQQSRRNLLSPGAGSNLLELSPLKPGKPHPILSPERIQMNQPLLVSKGGTMIQNLQGVREQHQQRLREYQNKAMERYRDQFNKLHQLNVGNYQKKLQAFRNVWGVLEKNANSGSIGVQNVVPNYVSNPVQADISVAGIPDQYPSQVPLNLNLNDVHDTFRAVLPVNSNLEPSQGIVDSEKWQGLNSQIQNFHTPGKDTDASPIIIEKGNAHQGLQFEKASGGISENAVYGSAQPVMVDRGPLLNHLGETTYTNQPSEQKDNHFGDKAEFGLSWPNTNLENTIVSNTMSNIQQISPPEDQLYELKRHGLMVNSGGITDNSGSMTHINTPSTGNHAMPLQQIPYNVVGTSNIFSVNNTLQSISSTSKMHTADDANASKRNHIVPPLSTFVFNEKINIERPNNNKPPDWEVSGTQPFDGDSRFSSKNDNEMDLEWLLPSGIRTSSLNQESAFGDPIHEDSIDFSIANEVEDGPISSSAHDPHIFLTDGKHLPKTISQQLMKTDFPVSDPGGRDDSWNGSPKKEPTSLGGNNPQLISKQPQLETQIGMTPFHSGTRPTYSYPVGAGPIEGRGMTHRDTHPFSDSGILPPNNDHLLKLTRPFKVEPVEGSPAESSLPQTLFVNYADGDEEKSQSFDQFQPLADNHGSNPLPFPIVDNVPLNLNNLKGNHEEMHYMPGPPQPLVSLPVLNEVDNGVDPKSLKEPMEYSAVEGKTPSVQSEGTQYGNVLKGLKKALEKAWNIAESKQTIANAENTVMKMPLEPGFVKVEEVHSENEKFANSAFVRSEPTKSRPAQNLGTGNLMDKRVSLDMPLHEKEGTRTQDPTVVDSRISNLFPSSSIKPSKELGNDGLLAKEFNAGWGHDSSLDTMTEPTFVYRNQHMSGMSDYNHNDPFSAKHLLIDRKNDFQNSYSVSKAPNDVPMYVRERSQDFSLPSLPPEEMEGQQPSIKSSENQSLGYPLNGPTEEDKELLGIGRVNSFIITTERTKDVSVPPLSEGLVFSRSYNDAIHSKLLQINDESHTKYGPSAYKARTDIPLNAFEASQGPSLAQVFVEKPLNVTSSESRHTGNSMKYPTVGDRENDESSLELRSGNSFHIITERTLDVNEQLFHLSNHYSNAAIHADHFQSDDTSDIKNGISASKLLNDKPVHVSEVFQDPSLSDSLPDVLTEKLPALNALPIINNDDKDHNIGTSKLFSDRSKPLYVSKVSQDSSFPSSLSKVLGEKPPIIRSNEGEINQIIGEEAENIWGGDTSFSVSGYGDEREDKDPGSHDEYNDSISIKHLKNNEEKNIRNSNLQVHNDKPLYSTRVLQDPSLARSLPEELGEKNLTRKSEEAKIIKLVAEKFEEERGSNGSFTALGNVDEHLNISSGSHDGYNDIKHLNTRTDDEKDISHSIVQLRKDIPLYASDVPLDPSLPSSVSEVLDDKLGLSKQVETKISKVFGESPGNGWRYESSLTTSSDSKQDLAGGPVSYGEDNDPLGKRHLKNNDEKIIQPGSSNLQPRDDLPIFVSEVAQSPLPLSSLPNVLVDKEEIARAVANPGSNDHNFINMPENVFKSGGNGVVSSTRNNRHPPTVTESHKKLQKFFDRLIREDLRLAGELVSAENEGMSSFPNEYENKDFESDVSNIVFSSENMSDIGLFPRQVNEGERTKNMDATVSSLPNLVRNTPLPFHHSVADWEEQRDLFNEDSLGLHTSISSTIPKEATSSLAEKNGSKYITSDNNDIPPEPPLPLIWNSAHDGAIEDTVGNVGFGGSEAFNDNEVKVPPLHSLQLLRQNIEKVWNNGGTFPEEHTTITNSREPILFNSSDIANELTDPSSKSIDEIDRFPLLIDDNEILSRPEPLIGLRDHSLNSKSKELANKLKMDLKVLKEKIAESKEKLAKKKFEAKQEQQLIINPNFQPRTNRSDVNNNNSLENGPFEEQSFNHFEQEGNNEALDSAITFPNANNEDFPGELHNLNDEDVDLYGYLSRSAEEPIGRLEYPEFDEEMEESDEDMEGVDEKPWSWPDAVVPFLGKSGGETTGTITPLPTSRNTKNDINQSSSVLPNGLAKTLLSLRDAEKGEKRTLTEASKAEEESGGQRINQVPRFHNEVTPAGNSYNENNSLQPPHALAVQPIIFSDGSKYFLIPELPTYKEGGLPLKSPQKLTNYSERSKVNVVQAEETSPGSCPCSKINSVPVQTMQDLNNKSSFKSETSRKDILKEKLRERAQRLSALKESGPQVKSCACSGGHSINLPLKSLKPLYPVVNRNKLSDRAVGGAKLTQPTKSSCSCGRSSSDEEVGCSRNSVGSSLRDQEGVDKYEIISNFIKWLRDHSKVTQPLKRKRKS